MKPSTPSIHAESVRRCISQPWPTICIHVPITEASWPHQFECTDTVTVGTELDLVLEVKWDGIWDDDPGEMQKHLSITEVPASIARQVVR